MLPDAPAGSFQLTDLDRQTQGELILVAEAASPGGSSEQVGFISIQEADYFIHHLMVDAAVHGNGVGRLLLRHLPEWGQARYRLKCLCSNTRATAFYKALGFIQIGTGMDADGEFAVFESSAQV